MDGETIHVLGLSGGKDSSALAVYMKKSRPELNIQYFFTDTDKELPEVYDYLDKLEGFLGKKILRLNAERGFDYWLEKYGGFLPQPRQRWCTRKLKIEPFEKWIKTYISDGNHVISYVGIRADEEDRSGMSSRFKGLEVQFPFKEAGIKKSDVLKILDESGLGLPKYYEWRSRSGCTFCFFQRKIEWVGLKERHPGAFEEAKRLETSRDGRRFTWNRSESLDELAKPERIEKIKQRERKRLLREQKMKESHPDLPGVDSADVPVFSCGEEESACDFCHR